MESLKGDAAIHKKIGVNGMKGFSGTYAAYSLNPGFESFQELSEKTIKKFKSKF